KVSAAPHGFDVSRVLWIGLDLLAQAAHVIVDRAIEQFCVAALGEVEKLVARERYLGSLEKGRKKPELAARQGNGHALRANELALTGIEYPVAEANSRRFRRLLARRQGLCAPEHGGNARDQLARRERLGDVVVRPHLETDDAVDLFT